MRELGVCMAAGPEYPKSVKEALRALGAAAQHKAFGLALLKTSEGTVRGRQRSLMNAA